MLGQARRASRFPREPSSSSPRPAPSTRSSHLEQMMPFVPFVRVSNVDRAIALAKESEHGFGHTAILHSRDTSVMSQMGKIMDCTIFVINGPCTAGLGLGGEGVLSFSIAGPTGEGVTTPLDLLPPAPHQRHRRHAIRLNDSNTRIGQIEGPDGMQLGRVIGTATATVKHPTFQGERLLVVQLETPSERPGRRADPGFDRLGAGRGDLVLRHQRRPGPSGDAGADHPGPLERDGASRRTVIDMGETR